MHTALAADTLCKVLHDDIVSRQLCWGAQLWVAHEGKVIADLAVGRDGIGRSVSTEMIVPLHCAGKPIVALAFAVLVDSGAVEFESRLGDVLAEPIPDALASVTFDELLSHRAGLHIHRAFDLALIPLDEQKPLMLTARQSGQGRTAYAEYASWYLVGLAIEQLTGEALRTVVTELVLRPLKLSDEVFMGFDEAAWITNRPRLAPDVDLRLGRPIPRLYEITALNARAAVAANGAYASMRGLGRLYTALLATLERGEVGIVSAATLHRMTVPSAPASFDPVMRRRCAYGLGFMVDLRDHNFGQCVSPSSFGHSGLASSTYGFVDAANSLAVAAHFWGIIDNARAIFARREQRMELVYELLGLSDTSSD